MERFSFKCVYCGSSCLVIGDLTYKSNRSCALPEPLISLIETTDSCGSCGRKAESTRVVLFEKKMDTAYRVNSIRIKIKQ